MRRLEPPPSQLSNDTLDRVNTPMAALLVGLARFVGLVDFVVGFLSRSLPIGRRGLLQSHGSA
jgi:hypothetical protein